MTNFEKLQKGVDTWIHACFGQAVARDRVERNHRFLEESLELVQANGCTQGEAHQLVDYVFGRPVGEIEQEVGGVIVTLLALCNAGDIDAGKAGEREMARVWGRIEKIRAKQAAKPAHSPLPIEAEPRPSPAIAIITAERLRQIAREGFDAAHDDKHESGELAMAAACYAAPEDIYRCFDPSSIDVVGLIEDPFPWQEPAWDKRDKHPPLRRLAIAAALIAAEMDRLVRIERARIVERLREFYETEEKIAAWWRGPHPQLEGRSAETLVYQGRAAEVDTVIDRLGHCAYL